jgi:AbiU2
LSPAEKLARLKAIVEHVGDQWTAVLHRQTYFHAMTRSAELAEALHGTYAAHVHNTIMDTFVIDLIREIGALVLDGGSHSASVAAAVKMLRDALVLDELRKDYRIVPSGRWLSERVPPEARREFDDADKERQVVENLAEFDKRLAEVTRIPGTILDTEIGELLRTARNKSVAHYDVVRDGGDWEMWRIEGTGLTYGKLGKYVDACTSAVDTLLHLVRQPTRDFDGTRHASQDYANDYIGALVLGLHRK